jgi:protein-S-isoprenylcysteine O-methyltransferase Ste14
MEFLGIILIATWLSVTIYWFVAARHTKRAVRKQTLSGRFGLLWLAIVGGFIGGNALRYFHLALIHPLSESFVLKIVCVGLVIAGAAFGVWARRTLGGNWSATVTIKEDHTLVRTGPYRWVRHPIYTALLTMIFATAIYVNTFMALYSAVVTLVALWVKLRLEEAWMTEQFGDEYSDYKRRVKALIPGVV